MNLTLKTLKEKLKAGCLCDYCGEKPAQGIVKAYEAVVCEECFEDHHGE